MRSTDGQASIEYVAIVALIAVVLGALTAGATAGTDISRRVSREWARAICLVSGGDCRRDQEPCVVVADGTRTGSQVNLLVVKLGGDTTVLVEERSDGTVALTRVARDIAGAELGWGGGVSIDLGGVDFAVGAELRAAALAKLGEGRTWIVGSPEEAASLLEDIEHDASAKRRDRVARGEDDPLRAPAPDITYEEREIDGSLAAALTGTAILDVAGAEAGGSLVRKTGTRIDRRTGRRTVYLRTNAGLDAHAELGDGILGVADGTERGGELYAVELDPSGAPVDLAVVATGRYDDDRDLPAVLSPIRGRLRTAAVDGRAYEVTAHLDLTDADNRAAAQRLIGALLRPGLVPTSVVAATSDLRRRVQERGTVEARVLAGSEDRSGFSLTGGMFAKIGMRWEHEEWSQRLMAAMSRGLDGQWLVREDCLSASGRT